MGKSWTLAGPCLAVLLALAPCASAQDEDPNRGDAYKDLALAARLISSKEFDRAERILADLVKDIPKSAAAWYQLALARQLQGKTKAAIEPVKKSLAIKKDDPNALLLGAELLAATDKTKAKTWALKAGGLIKDKPAQLKKVIDLLIKMRDVKSALPLLKKAQKDDPTNTDLLDMRARLALAAAKPKEAAVAYRQIVKLRPKDPMPAESLAFVLLAAEKRPDAVKAFRHLLKLNPSNLKARRTMIDLMFELKYSTKEIEGQKKYLEYYKWVKMRVAKRKREAKMRKGKITDKIRRAGKKKP